MRRVENETVPIAKRNQASPKRKQESKEKDKQVRDMVKEDQGFEEQAYAEKFRPI